MSTEHNASVVVVIPALNEAAVIATVVRQLRDSGFTRIVVCDNGSTDATASEAILAGAVVVHERDRGYGAACLAALRTVAMMDRVEIVVFADGDGSVKAHEVSALVNRIHDGYDLVVGARASDLQERHALTLPQRVGNVVACAMILAMWGVRMTDLGPLRAIRVEALQRLGMQDRKFGWTVEMQVKAIQHGLRYTEIPVSTRVRVGKSKISGTVRGVIGAALGIIGTILRLRMQQNRLSTDVAPSVETNAAQPPGI